jgi:hypothetical protein
MKPAKEFKDNGAQGKVGSYDVTSLHFTSLHLKRLHLVVPPTSSVGLVTSANGKTAGKWL